MPCIIEGDVFKTAVWTMDCRGKQRVTLVAESHVGSREYYENINDILGFNAPGVWVGMEGLREVEDESSLSPRIRRRLVAIDREMTLRGELARQVGLITRREGLPKEGRTNVDVTLDEFVSTWGVVRLLAVRNFNWMAQSAVDGCKAGKPQSEALCRRIVKRQYTGIVRMLGNPKLVEARVRSEAVRNSRAYGLMREALSKGLEARLVMGASHMIGIRHMLEADGYEVSDEKPLKCVDLGQLPD